MTYAIRAGQLAGLRLQDVHWRDGQITFPAAKRGSPSDCAADDLSWLGAVGVHPL
jgi:hypothetical protein